MFVPIRHDFIVFKKFRQCYALLHQLVFYAQLTSFICCTFYEFYHLTFPYNVRVITHFVLSFCWCTSAPFDSDCWQDIDSIMCNGFNKKFTIKNNLKRVITIAHFGELLQRVQRIINKSSRLQIAEYF